MITKQVEALKPDYCAVAFDLKAPTFRHKMYDAYKAGRRPMPDELALQLPVAKELLSALGYTVLEKEGYEADDILGTLARMCEENEDCEAYLLTGDRDSLQLISDRVHVLLATYTETIDMDEARFGEKYGVPSSVFVDVKALMGDSSDNIPGVAGVGPKTATDLLLKFGTLDGVYENLGDASIRPKLREKLEINKENAYLSYDLATIRTNAPIEFAPMDAVIQPYNKPALFELFTKLEFVRLIDRYGLRGAECACTAVSAEVKKLPRVTELPESCDRYAMYIGPDGSVGVAWQDGVCVLTPMEVQFQYAFFGDQMPCICHDCKSTYHALDGMGLPKVNCIFDTALAAYDLNPSQSDYPVSKLATNFLGVNVDDGDAAACAEAIWNLYCPLTNELEEKGMTKLYQEIALPLCDVLYSMEKEGVAIDTEQLERFGTVLAQRIADCESLIYSYSGEAFNINSTKQLGELLFEKLGLPALKKTKTGYSTNADVLEKLKNKHPIIPAIMDYRMLTKLKSTYADGLMKVVQADGRIRSTFQNLVTATGRLSSTEPNLQNIPVKTDLGAEIRKMFIPKDGYVLVDADYSQIELRVLAHIAKDTTMQKAFAENLDIHTVTASQVFGVEPENVTALQRRHAKAVNFGIVYGISEFSLSEDIGVSRYEAKRYIDSYLENYKGVRDYMRKVVEDARESGYTTTLYGRRRYVPELKSSNFNIRQGAERITLNTPIQGTAADLIKKAMIAVSSALSERFPEAKLILQVHDELIVECPEKDAAAVAELVSAQMQQVAALSVPLIAEAKWGKSWYDAK